MKKIINPWKGLEGYNCFGCAPNNEAGVKMEFYEDGDEVVSIWKPRPEYQGWIDTLHGGIQAVLMDEINHLILEGLFTTITNVNFDDASIKNLTARIHAAATKTANACNVSIVSDYDMNNIWNANEDIRSLKSLILFGVRGMAAYAYHAMTLGYTDASLNQFFLTALDSLSKDWGMNELLPIVMEVGRFNLTCMELLDRANTETFGDPVPVSVSLTVEKGPFIVVTGHDLEDIKQLLEQTKDKGINIYTNQCRNVERTGKNYGM